MEIAEVLIEVLLFRLTLVVESTDILYVLPFASCWRAIGTSEEVIYLFPQAGWVTTDHTLPTTYETGKN